MKTLINFTHIIALLATATMSGCCLVPNAVRPEFEHVSHATQHEPFTSHPGNCGYNAVNFVAKWTPAPRVVIEASEGINISRNWSAPSYPQYGSLGGPREIFTLRIGYEFRLRP